jgi:hypothetical protein
MTTKKGMSLTDGERLARLEAEAAIRDLKYEYAALCDSGYDGPSLGRLFTDDANWDGGKTFGRYEGRPAIEAFFSGLAGSFVWALHYMIGPRFTKVADDATSAEAAWYLWMPYLELSAGEPRRMLLTAKQSDRYRLEGGAWLFEEIVVDVESIGPAADGWTPDAIKRDIGLGTEPVA